MIWRYSSSAIVAWSSAIDPESRPAAEAPGAGAQRRSARVEITAS
jgi:hypothetical protein